MSTTSTDRIEKTIDLKAPRSRVWRALTNAEEFGAWFGVKLTGTFEKGAAVAGQITIKGYEHVTLNMVVDTIEPERLFSFRWHPNAIDAKLDYSREPMTLVEFRLEETRQGTQLTLVEAEPVLDVANVVQWAPPADHAMDFHVRMAR